MALADGNKLYIGAQNCSNTTIGGVFQGCLSIYPTTGTTAVISSTRSFLPLPFSRQPDSSSREPPLRLSANLESSSSRVDHRAFCI